MRSSGDPINQELSKSTKCQDRESSDQMAEKTMSKIEAELEAELKRLERSFKTSTLSKISNYVEVFS